MELFSSVFFDLMRTVSFKPARRKLDNGDPLSAVVRFDMYDAAAACLDGFTIGMDCSDAQLRHELNGFHVDVAGYAVEGAALAIGASARLDSNWDRLANFLSSSVQHQMNAASGCGGAFAHAGLAITSIPTNVNPFWRWVLLDGYAFHQAFFNANTVIVNQQMPDSLSAWERRAYNQGIGRAIWYAAAGRPDFIKELIGHFAPWQRSDLWYGVGLQSGYCGGIEREFHQLRRHAGKGLDGLSAGVVMAVVTRAACGYYPDHTRYASEVICGAKISEVVGLFEKALAEAQDAGHRPDLFLNLRKQLAQGILS